MTEQPLPLPAEHRPHGVREWRSADAREWLAAAPGRWARPQWAALALIATYAWAFVDSPEPVCTDSAPCQFDWWPVVFFGFAVLQLYWLVRQPVVALWVVPPTAAANLLHGDALGTASDVSRLAVTAAAGFAVVGLLYRLELARRQRHLAMRAAGDARYTLPPRLVPFTRGRISLVFGVGCLALAAFGLWRGSAVVAEDESRAAAATRVEAEVLGYRENGLAVTLLPEGRRHHVDAFGDHRKGDRVTVLIDGDWSRLAAEPPDAGAWEALVLVGGLPGLAFVVNALVGRRRAARLRSLPVPALRVLIKEKDDDPRVWVYAHDDRHGTTPVLTFHSLPTDEDEDEEDEEEEDADERERALDGEGAESVVESVLGAMRDQTPPVLREAVLYGPPSVGAEVAFTAVGGRDLDEIVTECSATPVRAVERRERRGRSRSLARLALDLEPTAAPRVWSAGGWTRLVGLALGAFQAAGIWALLSDGFSWQWFLLLGLPALIGTTATALNWRIVADRTGLWTTGGWRIHHVPWERISSIHLNGSTLEITQPGDEDDAALEPVGWPALERRLGGGESDTERLLAELRAMYHDPSLRPADESTPAQRGTPLGPLFTLLLLVWAVTVLVLP
ncbi:hypothetical protein [Streptomyces alkaliterrae]|uniref:Uncharacterized protein n=1 Tax=Streptomyces alkaliterrae TaxID=2213162 RepID=A0A5P0YX75_9ACTN|nr:hypothetical protein [Streptomyces alkaliterrae]MBB1259668.1 hypothetical protein [Streptomyces alkaliterrae]MQS04886.1 hypothetical protein [Streptomyces alkaliterrae]